MIFFLLSHLVCAALLRPKVVTKALRLSVFIFIFCPQLGVAMMYILKLAQKQQNNPQFSQDCTNREEELRKAGSLNTRHSFNGLSDEPVDDQEVEGEGDQGNQQLKIASVDLCVIYIGQDEMFVCINFKTR